MDWIIKSLLERNGLAMVIAAIIAIIIIYYAIRWIIATRRGSDRADDHALGCINLLSWGCCFPLTLTILLLATLF